MIIKYLRMLLERVCGGLPGPLHQLLLSTTKEQSTTTHRPIWWKNTINKNKTVIRSTIRLNMCTLSTYIVRLFLYYSTARSQSQLWVGIMDIHRERSEWEVERNSYRFINRFGIDYIVSITLRRNCPGALVDGCCWRCRLTDSICSRRRIISPQQPFNYCDGRQFGRTYQLSMQNTDRYRHRWVLGSVVISHSVAHYTTTNWPDDLVWIRGGIHVSSSHPYVTLMHKLIQC